VKSRVENHFNSLLQEYLKTICNADEKVTMQFPGYLTPILSKPGNYQNIEEQSGAAILFCSEGEIDILGSEIAVTLAMSAVEDFVSRYEIESPEGNETETEDMKKRSDARLDSQLKIVCEKHDLPYEDYCHTPSAVKRTLLSWLSNDMDKIKEADTKLPDDVVADGIDDSVVITDWWPSTSESIIILDTPEPKPKKTSATGPQINLFGNQNNLKEPKESTSGVSPVGEMTNVFQKSFSDVGKNKLESPTVVSLRQFALGKGYSSAEVDEVLAENPNHRLSTVITALHYIRTKKEVGKNGSKPEPMDVEPMSKAGTAFSHSVPTARDSSPRPGARTSSPAEENKGQDQPNSWSINQDYDKSVFKYFKQLSKHFTEETSDLSREDLLKNNAERQQILKDAYEKAFQESLKTQNQGTDGKKGKHKLRRFVEKKNFKCIFPPENG
jgi:hypothetical protein